MNGRSRAAVGAALLLGAVAGGLIPATSGAATGGPVKLYVTPSATTSPKHPGKVLFTGAIGDYGTAVSVNAAGKPTQNGTYRLARLKKGTILVDITTFQKALQAAFTSPSTYDPTNCSVSVSVTAPVSVVKGSGAYDGITGSLTLTGVFADISPRTKGGACTTKTATEPLATYQSIAGSGTITAL